MSEISTTRLLDWYKTWNEKLSQSIAKGEYAKVIDIHFKNGIFLLTALKNAIKNNPELKEILKEEIDMVRSKMIIIQNARKSFDSLK